MLKFKQVGDQAGNVLEVDLKHVPSHPWYVGMMDAHAILLSNLFDQGQAKPG